MLNAEMIDNILVFLQRVDLKGSEAQVLAGIQQELVQQSQELKNPKPIKKVE